MKPSNELRIICRELSGNNWFDVTLVIRACKALGFIDEDALKGSRSVLSYAEHYGYRMTAYHYFRAWITSGYCRSGLTGWGPNMREVAKFKSIAR